MSLTGCLDVAGVCLVAFGTVWCVAAMPDNPDFASVAAVLAFVYGSGAVFWVAPALRRGWRAWPVRFPDPGGNTDAANGMVVWWRIAGLTAVVTAPGVWYDIGGLWFLVGAAAVLLAAVRVACAYTEHGWRIIRMKW